MPFLFPDQDDDPLAQKTFCAACHARGDGCMADLRLARVRGRATTFRISQDRLISCAFDDFIPGCLGDPNPDRPFSDYRMQAKRNLLRAAGLNFAAGGLSAAFTETDVKSAALGKVDGDMYELLEAAALWNAAAAWNEYMSSGVWPASTFMMPPGAIATPLRRVAIVKLPRGYDSTRLLTPAARAAYEAFQRALTLNDMQLKLSSPDIVGLRIPDPMPASYERFLVPLDNLLPANFARLNEAHREIEGTIEGRNFLFAIAVKTSTRSDRLYQPLFEANVLKFLIGFVLRGSMLKFHVHMESFEGADVAGAYKAASLYSLTIGGGFSRAVDHLYKAVSPRETGQEILNSFPEFAI